MFYKTLACVALKSVEFNQNDDKKRGSFATNCRLFLCIPIAWSSEIVGKSVRLNASWKLD